MLRSGKAMSRRDKLVARAFEAFAPEYDEKIGRSMLRDAGVGYEDFLQGFARLTGDARDNKILDLATGTANVALAIARIEQGRCSIAAVDLTEGMLRKAKQKVQDAGLKECVHVCKGSGDALPFAGDSFSLVTCSLAFHHMPVTRVLQELKRALAPEGRLVMGDVIAAPAWRTPWGRIIAPVYLLLRSIKDRRPIRNGSRMHTLQEWKNMLLSAGFTIAEQECFSKGMWRPRLVLISAVMSAEARPDS